jgi:hypothetical protein
MGCALLIVCWHSVATYQLAPRKSCHLHSIPIYGKPPSTHAPKGIHTSSTNNCTTAYVLYVQYSISIKHFPHFAHLYSVMKAFIELAFTAPYPSSESHFSSCAMGNPFFLVSGAKCFLTKTVQFGTLRIISGSHSDGRNTWRRVLCLVVIFNAWVGTSKRASPGVIPRTAIRMSYLDRAVIHLTRLEVPVWIIAILVECILHMVFEIAAAYVGP